VALGRATVLDRVVEAATFCTVDCTDVVAPFSAVLRSLLSLLSGFVPPSWDPMTVPYQTLWSKRAARLP